MSERTPVSNSMMNSQSEPAGQAKAVAVGRIFEDVPLTIEHLKAGLALFMVFAIDAWEMMIMVYTSPLISRDFNLGPVEVGALIGSIFIGMTIGSLLWGPVCDRLGRKKSIIFSLLSFGAISLVGAFSVSYMMLYVIQLLAGVAAAGMFVTTFPLFEELLPVKVRGKYTVYLASGWPIGMLMALGVVTVFSPFGWRWIIAFSALASLWAVVVWRWVPESPYWLAGAGRQSEAKDVIAKLSGNKIVIPALQILAVEEVQRGSTAAIFNKKLRGTTILQVLVNFSFSWGYWGLQTWLPTLLAQRGLSLPESYSFIALSAVCMIPGYISASFLTGRYGRKKVMIAYVALSAVAGFGFANATSVEALYLCNFLLAFFSLGAWGVWDTWIGELYPTGVRVIGYSWGVMAQRLANTVAPSVVGVLVAHSTSFSMTANFINMFLFATVILALFLPETEGEDLH